MARGPGSSLSSASASRVPGDRCAPSFSPLGGFHLSVAGVEPVKSRDMSCLSSSPGTSLLFVSRSLCLCPLAGIGGLSQVLENMSRRQ